MPEMFTELLAKRLDTISNIHVMEGENGQKVKAGEAYIARGGMHMEIVDRRGDLVLKTHNGPKENACRPSVDVLFRSVAKCGGDSCLSVILTGMGKDGFKGTEAIREKGGQVIAQDEASSVVWGMPGYVVKGGLAHAEFPLLRITEGIVKRVTQKR